MLRNIYFVVLCLLLAAILSCKPEIDLKPDEDRLQKEAYEFEKVIGDIAIGMDNIKYLSDVSLNSLLPDDWLCEITKPSKDELSVALGIPIPGNLARGWKIVKTEGGAGMVTVTYRIGDKLDPITDRYIVSSYSGTTTIKFDKTNLTDYRNYPKLLSLDCFPGKQKVQSPYYIPNEATHGIYFLSGPEFRRSRSDYNISQLLNDLSVANPYVEKSGRAKYEAPELPAVVESFKEQIAEINKDISTANAFIKAIEQKYRKGLAAGNSQEAIDDFKKMLNDNKAKLIQINDYLDKLNAWDFTRLEQYRSLKSPQSK